jgi:hypothetical protein
MIYFLTGYHTVYDLREEGFEEVNYFENEAKIQANGDKEAIDMYIKHFVANEDHLEVTADEEGEVSISTVFEEDDKEFNELVRLYMYTLKKIHEPKISG